MGEAENVQTLRQQLEDKINELAQANSQVTKLRRTTLKQLSSIDNITKPLFALDREYFGAKFQDSEDGSNPFQDMQIAVEIVDAVRAQLSGQTVMADTPQLREQLGSLGEAIDSLRDGALNMRRHSLEAVGLPADSSGFSARSFPEDDPVAFIVDASGFARELQGICERTTGRIQALTTMVQNADQVREQVEDQLEEFKTNPKVLAETARREAEILQSELNDLRIVLAQMQESQGSQRAQSPQASNGDSSAKQGALIQGLQLELERGNADRQADLAEVRSLAGDICMLAGEMARGSEGNDLASARKRLKEILENPHADIGSLAAHAETVFLRLAESLQQKTDTIRNELQTLREQNDAGDADKVGNQDLLIKAEASLQGIQAELKTATIEISDLQEQLRSVSQERDQLQQRIDASGQSSTALEQQLGVMNGKLQQTQNRAEDAERSVARLQGELTQATTERDEAKTALQALELSHADLSEEARGLMLELAEAEARLRTLEKDLAAMQAQARNSSAAAGDAQAEKNKAERSVEEARADAKRQVELLEKRASQAEAERDKVRHELQDGRRSSEESLRRVSDIENAKDDAERSMRAQKAHATELEKEIVALKGKLLNQEQLVKDQQAESLKIAKERDLRQHDVERLEKELSNANQRAATSTADAARVQSGSTEEIAKMKQQLEAQAEGRRNRETMFHAEKVALEKAVDDMKKAHAILQERFEDIDREYKSLQRQVNIEKQNRQVTDSDASQRVRDALNEVEKYRSEREKQDALISKANDLKKESERKIAANEDEMNKMRSARDAMQRQMAESHRQTQALEEKTKQLIAAHKNEKAAAEQQRVLAEKERQNVAIQNSDLQKRLNALLETHKHTQTEFEKQSDLMGKMKIEYDETIVKMRHREEEVVSLSRRIERMEKDLSSISSSRDTLADNLARTGTREDEQKRSIANLERQMRAAQEQNVQQVGDLKALLTKAREQIVAAKREIEAHDQTDREIIRELLEQVKRNESSTQT